MKNFIIVTGILLIGVGMGMIIQIYRDEPEKNACTDYQLSLGYGISYPFASSSKPVITCPVEKLECPEPQVCIHERYKQIKDTMKSKAGDEFMWNGEDYWFYNEFDEPIKSFGNTFNYVLEAPIYTKEEILNTEFFEPL